MSINYTAATEEEHDAKPEKAFTKAMTGFLNVHELRKSVSAQGLVFSEANTDETSKIVIESLGIGMKRKVENLILHVGEDAGEVPAADSRSIKAKLDELVGQPNAPPVTDATTMADLDLDAMSFRNILKVLAKSFIGLQTDLSTVKNDLATIKSDIAIIKNDLATIKNDLATIKSDLATIKGDLATVKVDIAIIKNDLTDVNGGIKAVKTLDISSFNATCRLENRNCRDEDNLRMPLKEFAIAGEVARLGEAYGGAVKPHDVHVMTSDQLLAVATFYCIPQFPDTVADRRLAVLKYLGVSPR